MNWTVQQKIRVGFWLLAFVPIVVGALAWRNANELLEASQQLDTANQTSQLLEKIFSEIKDIEVAQREYILTGETEAIKTIRRTDDAIQEDLEKLYKLRNPDDKKNEDTWIALLRSLIPEKMDQINRAIERRNEVGLDTVSQVLLTKRASEAMESIRVVIRNMRGEESRLLQNRRAEQSKRLSLTLQLFAVVLLVNVALIAMIYLLQRRETQRSHETQLELERRVALRTEELQRSNEDLQQFAYIASHDLKEPLRMISSYSTLLQRRYGGRLDKEADTFLHYVVDGARRMNELIQDVLDYSRAGSGKDEQLSDVEVNAVLQNVMANLKVTIMESGATVKWDGLPETVPYDTMRLTQVFQNLIGNAIKYRGKRRPEVVISSFQEGDDVVFTVKDNGIGIEPQYIDKIFGIFQRLHGKEYEGTGIGLAMVKKIVERYGGRIWVVSTPGEGSAFSFTVQMTAPLPNDAALSTSTS